MKKIKFKELTDGFYDVFIVDDTVDYEEDEQGRVIRELFCNGGHFISEYEEEEVVWIAHLSKVLRIN